MTDKINCDDYEDFQGVLLSYRTCSSNNEAQRGAIEVCSVGPRRNLVSCFFIREAKTRRNKILNNNCHLTNDEVSRQVL